MPQPPSKRWKRTIFTAIAHAEHALREFNFPTDLQELRNFLFLQYESPLGSVVHATPVFEALKHSIPNAHITVAASRMAANVLAHSPYIDRCIVTPNPIHHFAKSLPAVRALVQSMPPGPRSIVTTIGNQRTRVALLGLLAGKSVRAGYTLAPELYAVPLPFHPQRGQIEGNLDILRSLGHDIPFCEPRIFFTAEDANHARTLVQALAENSTRIAFVTQNSGGQPNRWIEARFAEVIAQLSQTHNATPIFVGTSADAPAIERLRQSLPSRGISAAGETTIPQLAALLAQCDLVVSLDTGTFHVGRAVGLPGVVIAPAWQDPREWLPIDHPRYRVVRGPSLATQPSGYCMEEISVPQVVNAATELLELFPPSVATRQARLDRAAN